MSKGDEKVQSIENLPRLDPDAQQFVNLIRRQALDAAGVALGNRPDHFTFNPGTGGAGGGSNGGYVDESGYHSGGGQGRPAIPRDSRRDGGGYADGSGYHSGAGARRTNRTAASVASEPFDPSSFNPADHDFPVSPEVYQQVVERAKQLQGQGYAPGGAASRAWQQVIGNLSDEDLAKMQGGGHVDTSSASRAGLDLFGSQDEIARFNRSVQHALGRTFYDASGNRASHVASAPGTSHLGRPGGPQSGVSAMSAPNAASVAPDPEIATTSNGTYGYLSGGDAGEPIKPRTPMDFGDSNRAAVHDASRRVYEDLRGGGSVSPPPPVGPPRRRGSGDGGGGGGGPVGGTPDSWFVGPDQRPIGEQVEPFLNPYIDNVVNAARREYDHLRGRARMATNDAATAAGAFGGSRHGVAEAVRLAELDRSQAGQVAGLHHQGYQSALQTALPYNEHVRQLRERLRQEPLFRQQQAMGFLNLGLGPVGIGSSQVVQQPGGSALGAAASGASIGTAISPGVGTVIGGGLGYLGGLLGL